MWVAIALAVTEGIAISVGIAQMGRHLLTLRFTHLSQRFEHAAGAVAFFGACQVKSCLRQWIQSLRQSDALKGRGTGLHHHDRLGIRKSHVLPRGDQHATENEAWVFAGFDHPCQPEQSRVCIGATQGFDECADRVEVRVALLVVKHCALLNGFLSNAKVDLDHALLVFRRALHGEFECIEQAARVTSRHIDEMGRGIVSDLHLAIAVATFLVAQGGVQ